MQTANANPQITVTVRHETVTESLRDYAEKKIEGIHLDYPRIIEAKAILDVQKNRHIAEIILFCANHIVIDASSETEDMYKSIDETIDKVARRMRKYKTRLLKKYRPRPEDTIKHLDEKVYASDILDELDAADAQEVPIEDPEPLIIHRESFRLRTLYKEEAIMDLELTERPFVLYKNARRGVHQIVYRRKDGEYSIVEFDAQNI